MRLLLLSDIHSNLEALEACLDAAPDYDLVANLGDVVGYGGSPNQTVELLRATDPINVRGNHDRACCGLTDTTNFNPVAAAAAHWTRNELSDRNLDWLRELPQGPVRDKHCKGVQFVHGSPVDEDYYITSAVDAGDVLASARCELTFFGHTHVQCAYARPHEVSGRLVPERMQHRQQNADLPAQPDSPEELPGESRARWGSRATATGAPPSRCTTAWNAKSSSTACPTTSPEPRSEFCRRGCRRCWQRGWKKAADPSAKVPRHFRSQLCDPCFAIHSHLCPLQKQADCLATSPARRAALKPQAR